MKFEIILFYYKRPHMVLNALESIKELYYKNWHLTLIDDSGNDDFKNDFLNFGFDDKMIEYIPIMMSDEEKTKLGGSIFGKYANDIIQKTDADVIIPLCDDDAILPDYMDKLNDFYSKNPDELWSYCHVKFFNPETEKYTESKLNPDNPNLNRTNLNANTHPINPYCTVDSSQVTFRKVSLVNGDVWYPFPQTINLDATIFLKMYKKYGLCKFMGSYGQYKGWFENQLGNRIRLKKTTFI